MSCKYKQTKSMFYNCNSFDSFSVIEWHDFHGKIINAIDCEIDNCSDEYILNVNENEYITYLTDKYSFVPLVIDNSSEEIEEPKEFKEDLSQYDNRFAYAKYGRYRVGYSIQISYSYSGSVELFKVRPNPFTLTSNKIMVDEYSSRVSFEIILYSQDVSEFQRKKDSAYQRAFANVENINLCIKGHNDSLARLVKQKFNNVKQKRLSKNNFFAAIKVKKSTASPSTYGVPVVTKRKIVKPQCPKAKMFSPEPSLDMSTYKNIITELNQVGSSMERKPSLYLNKDEEGLRDVFLTMLETRFEGTTATGETFNHGGKTDILLKNSSDGSNLFIAECKFWHGPKHFKESINQLFDRYLTWRDSKTALIIFVNGTDFTAVLNSIQENVICHPYYVRLNEKHDNTSTNYIFRLPQDRNKEVYLEVMAFNFDKNIESRV